MNNQFLDKPWWVKRSNRNNPRHTLYNRVNSLDSIVEDIPANSKNLSLGYAGTAVVYLAAFLLYLASACGGQSTITPVNPTPSTATRTINTPTQRPEQTLEAIAQSTPTAAPMPTETPTLLPTLTPYPTATSTPEPTATPTPMPTPIPTNTPQPTPTNTPMPTPTYTPRPTATPVPTPVPTATPVPLPDLQIANISYNFLKVNDNDGTTSYSLTVAGTYGLTKPNKPFSIGILGLEGIIDSTHQVTRINNDGTFALEIPEVRLPDKNSPTYKISAVADIDKVIDEQNENNNESSKFVLEVREPQTFTRDVVKNYKLVAHHREYSSTNESIPKRGWDENAPIRIYIDEAPDKYRGMLGEVIGYLGENNVDVDFASDVSSGNSPIFIGTHARYYEKYPHKNKEFYNKRAGSVQFTARGNIITKAEIVIFTDSIQDNYHYSDKFVQSAMIEEILQISTGLLNDLDNYQGIFAQYKTRSGTELTEMDKEIIRLGNVIPAGTLERDVEKYIRVN